MPPVVIPGTIRFVIEGQFLGVNWVSALHVGKGLSAWDQADHDAVVAAFSAFYTDLATPIFSDSFHVQTMTSTDISAVDGPQFITAVAIDGTSASAALPPDVCLVISWLTARRGRSFRGRTYLTGFTELSNDAGRPTGSVLADVDAASEALIDAVSTAGHPLVVASRFLLESNAVDSARVGNSWDRQRRRRMPEI